jgi:hypothetical protein
MSDTAQALSRGTEPSGLRRYALAGYRWLLLAFLLAGSAQIFLAGLGVLAVVLSGVLVVQTTLLQSLLAGLADNAALYGGLHALDGILILAIAGFLYAMSRR